MTRLQSYKFCKGAPGCTLQWRLRSIRTSASQRYICTRIIELIFIAFRPPVKCGYVHHDLSFGIEFHMSAVHRPWCGTFEINPLAVIATAVAGTFEFVFARFPIRRATQVGAASVDHKYSVGSLVHPNAILLLPLGVDPQRIIGGKANAEHAGRLENRPGQKKPQKHQEARSQKPRDGGPDY